MTQSHPSTDESLGDLLSELSTQTSRLVRDEIHLAQKEFRESARHAGLGAGLIGIAGVFALLGALAVVAAAVAAVALVLPVWAAALIVGAALLALAGLTALISWAQAERTTPVAARTVTTMKQNIDSVKEAGHVSS